MLETLSAIADGLCRLLNVKPKSATDEHVFQIEELDSSGNVRNTETIKITVPAGTSERTVRASLHAYRRSCRVTKK